MARARRELAEAELPQLAPNRALVQAHAEPCKQPGRQILAPPAHHAVPIRIGAALDDRGERQALLLAQLGRMARSLAVDQPGRAVSVEGQNPVAYRLQAYNTDPSCFRAAAPIVDLSQRQQTAALACVAPSLGQTARVIGTKVFAKRHCSGHGKTSQCATSNQIPSLRETL